MVAWVGHWSLWLPEVVTMVTWSGRLPGGVHYGWLPGVVTMVAWGGHYGYLEWSLGCLGWSLRLPGVVTKVAWSGH